MGWVHDTGYRPAYAHEGYVAAILDDGTDTNGVRGASVTGTSGERVVGWRAACSCGWRAEATHRRADYPDEPGAALRGVEPDSVDGWEPEADAPVQGISCYAAWQHHLHAVVPELAVHDAVTDHREAAARIETAVATAREAGASWEAIGDAAGISRQSAHERWRHLGTEGSGSRRLSDQTPHALAAAVDALEDRGPVATARRADQGWQITITEAEDVLARIDVDHEWGPASMGHRLIEHGWIVCSPAVHVRDRAAGWADRGHDTYTAPVTTT